MFDKKLFGECIRRLRTERGVSQSALAEYLGVSKQAVSMIESGKRAPSPDVFISLADFFDVSLDYLVGRSDNPRRLP